MIKDLTRFLHILHIFLKARIDLLLPEENKLNILIKFIILPWSLYSKENNRGERLSAALEEAGPVFIKFGQILSTRPDLIPEDIVKPLKKLQDNLPPFSTKEAKALIESELKAKLSDLFIDFEDKPIAAASIAQVYKAKLKESKKQVAIKVVRPKIQNRIKKDISLMKRLAALFERYSDDAKRLKIQELVEEYEFVINTELDMRSEASNMRQTRRNFENNNLLHVPEVFIEYTADKVLTMELVEGIPVDDLEKLRAKNIDLKLLSERGVEIFLKQVFVDNFFHADMHPGNIFINTDDTNGPTYLAVDYAIIGSLTDEELIQIGRMILAVISRDFLQVSSILIDAGWVNPETKAIDLEKTIRTACEPMFDQPLEKINFGELLLYIFNSARRYGLSMQPSLMLLQKTLINIEGLGKQIYPNLDFWSISKPFLQQWISERYNPKKLEDWAKKNAVSWIEKAKNLPKTAEELVNKINKLEEYKSEDKLRHEEILSKISLGKKVSSVLQASILAAMILILVGIFI